METSAPTVVICDVHLPDGPDGLWLADKIRKLYPTTAMILATGDHTVPSTQSLRKGIVAYLVKPFQREEIVRAIEHGVRWSIAETQKNSARGS
jgi:DNA-binding NtrC family response regulator